MSGDVRAAAWDLDTYRERYDEVLERCRRLQEEKDRLQRLASLLMDLDRCEHGRHEEDVCSGASGCNGPSRGNPRFHAGDVLGFTLYGAPIVMPERGQRHDPDAWVAAPIADGGEG